LNPGLGELEGKERRAGTGGEEEGEEKGPAQATRAWPGGGRAGEEVREGGEEVCGPRRRRMG
jgi:hypothetical protein